MLSFQKKNAGQRATISFQPAIFTRTRRACDTYTMDLNSSFQGDGMDNSNKHC